MTLVEIYSLGNNPIPLHHDIPDLVKLYQEGWRPKIAFNMTNDDMEM